jgi:hypothetical protein
MMSQQQNPSQTQTQEFRKYERIWIEIKKHGYCKIKPASLSLALFARIKKAVIKEKYNDLSFKFEQDDRRVKLEVTRDSTTGIISFKLHKGLGMEDV